jgi:hypothetical protein
MIGDGDTMGIAAEIIQDVLWSGEGPTVNRRGKMTP